MNTMDEHYNHIKEYLHRAAQEILGLNEEKIIKQSHTGGKKNRKGRYMRKTRNVP